MWSVFLRLSAGNHDDINDKWYLFKAFNDVNKALASEAGFRRSDFEVMLIYTIDLELTLTALNQIQSLLVRA